MIIINSNMFVLNRSRELFCMRFSTVLMLLCFICACQQQGASRNDEIVVKVNNHPIYQTEFREYLNNQVDKASSARINKKAKKKCMNILIERALLVQEAVKEGLSKEKGFIQSVERFWEQTLISNLLKRKEAEFDKMVVVREDEIENYYNLMGVEIRYRYCRGNNLDMARQYLRRINIGEEIPWDEETCFLTIEDVPLSLGLELFNKNKGESFVSQIGQDYIVALVIDRKKVTRKPFRELRDEIKRELVKHKKEILMQKWINELKQNATLEINETYLE